MRIYLDSCCLQRLLDDQTQPRIKVETEAVLAILAAVEAGDVVLLNSEALEYELGRIPNLRRREEAVAVLGLAKGRNAWKSQIKRKFWPNPWKVPGSVLWTRCIWQLHLQLKRISLQHAMIGS